jgi:hypothetical protein
MTQEQMRFQAAAMAMQGLLSNPHIAERYGLDESDVISQAIKYADALLSALYPTGKDKHGYCDPCTGADMEAGPGEMLASITPE